VIEEGKTVRDIYLPAGTWRDGNTGQIYEGKSWIRNYPAPIDVLPYFLKDYDDILLKKIEFSNSKFHINVKNLRKDNSYVLEVFNGNCLKLVEYFLQFYFLIQVINIFKMWCLEMTLVTEKLRRFYRQTRGKFKPTITTPFT
jgi:hypothetical protein